jgi:competence protein ComEA
MANLFAPAATAAAPDRQPPVLAAPETLAPPVAVAPAPAPAPAEDGRVSVPAGLVLRALPEAMRGPAWSAEGPTGAVISVPREQLLRQLAAGCVELTLDQARAQLPDGMCSANAQGTLVLDLAAVVAAVPTELMQASGEMDQEAVAAAAMADLFATATAPRVAAPTTPPPGRPPETIAVPCGAILSVLPAALRGPAWRAEGFPDVVIDLPKADVLTQLAAGSVTAALSLLEGKIPAGWLAGDAAGDVTLNLSDVVAAVPPEMMAVQEDMVDEAVAAAQLGQLFVPAAAPTAHTAPPAVPEVAAAAPAEAATALPVAAAQAGPATAPPPVEPSAAPPPPTAANADTSDTRPEPRPVGPALLTTEETDAPQAELLPEWGGIEESWERAPHGVDLNVARAAELMQLPGVGETRAQAIIAYRSAHGHFRSVYDLAAVPGVGPALFRRMTGLSVRNRVDRHAAMEHLLALPADQRPLLARIVEAIRAEFSASGAVLTNREGMPLAISGTMVEASRYAALGSRFFFRARRHLQKFVARASDCIILPGSTPPLLLLSSEDVVVILTLSGGAVLRKRLSRVTRAMREVGWLLSRRAVVLRG